MVTVIFTCIKEFLVGEKEREKITVGMRVVGLHKKDDIVVEGVVKHIYENVLTVYVGNGKQVPVNREDACRAEGYEHLSREQALALLARQSKKLEAFKQKIGSR